ncbi:MAG: XRE family transcriptional regulator [Variovorax paradoxus]|uniref:XRE family transcriptional regulator n=1 Tax=Variovorax paradoxus TaxID=34073 RepID=A0A2W5QL25_VARPD|nr:MAG: XRE family transcriptional regulator [Variovorax paradoxus]
MRPIDIALELARREKGWNQTQFATEIGASSADISNWKKRGMPPEWHKSAAVAIGVTVDRLLSGNIETGPVIQGRVPLISWIQAGSWGEAVDAFEPGDAEDWIPCIRKHSSSSYALRVKGDSMTAPHGNTRSYPAGSIIFVDPEKRSPVNGDRIVAKLEGSAEVTFKVYKEEDGRRWLMPLNPAHEPIRDPFKVLGTVIGKWEDE